MVQEALPDIPRGDAARREYNPSGHNCGACLWSWSKQEQYEPYEPPIDSVRERRFHQWQDNDDGPNWDMVNGNDEFDPFEYGMKMFD